MDAPTVGCLARIPVPRWSGCGRPSGEVPWMSMPAAPARVASRALACRRMCLQHIFLVCLAKVSSAPLTLSGQVILPQPGRYTNRDWPPRSVESNCNRAGPIPGSSDASEDRQAPAGTSTATHQPIDITSPTRDALSRRSSGCQRGTKHNISSPDTK
jgi:hypothetical protein